MIELEDCVPPLLRWHGSKVCALFGQSRYHSGGPRGAALGENAVVANGLCLLQEAGHMVYNVE